MEILTDTAFGLAFVISTVTLSLGSYMLARRVAGRGPYDRHKEMAGAMVTRIAAMHGLIIALVFAQEMSSYQRLETQTAAEASAIADVFNDAARYDPMLLQPVQQNMREYLKVVIDTEWDQLGAGRGLSDAAWAAWATAYDQVLDLVPQTPRQTSLRDHMLTSLHAISASRDMRQAEAVTSVAHFFWIAALSGVVLIAFGHYIYTPERHNLVLLALFSAYTGAILFLIFGFSNPYSPPAALDPAPLQTLAVDAVDVAGFDAVFLPGGHGTVWDLPGSAALARGLSAAYAAGKVVSAVCHGPAGLVAVTDAAGAPLVRGKRVAGFTDSEEVAAGLDQTVPFLLESKLRELGGLYEKGDDFQPFAVADGRLVTGQNPASSELVAKLVLEALG